MVDLHIIPLWEWRDSLRLEEEFLLPQSLREGITGQLKILHHLSLRAFEGGPVVPHVVEQGEVREGLVQRPRQSTAAHPEGLITSNLTV